MFFSSPFEKGGIFLPTLLRGLVLKLIYRSAVSKKKELEKNSPALDA
jgi:hypothetical protein